VLDPLVQIGCEPRTEGSNPLRPITSLASQLVTARRRFTWGSQVLPMRGRRVDVFGLGSHHAGLAMGSSFTPIASPALPFELR